eukprot:TRINITY_DN3204_c0_g1_i4.p2 TRINITY_DN3204_c0_g1~~TRINITY_DN3204_c0_g1_i4.p2  ORF type:complete len:257 (+),score=55.59 TRINITY_DN3204_c0_g1_i4:878-1648(+)
MKNCKPGLREFQLASLFHYYTSWRGCFHDAYLTIVGSGKNSAILHYNRNSEIIKDGDLVLVDAGCEYFCYASDITRTFPSNGKFSQDQKMIYGIVLNVQKELISMVIPGRDFRNLCSKASELLVEGLIEVGIIHSCTSSEAIKKGLDRIFMPHGLGHLMGLDVHDTTIYPKVPLVENMVITMEPGLYFNKFLVERAVEDKEKASYLNHEVVKRMVDSVGGVRIEDVLVVVNDGALVLSRFVPKEIEEIEKLMCKTL